jgi:DNA-binding response OmpR family regulator
MSAVIPGQKAPTPPSSLRKVLVVDQDSNDLNGCAEVLRQQPGYDVHACSCWDEGASRVERERFDFILVCQGGPQFEGRVVLERAMAKDRHTPVLVVTRCHSMNCYLEAMQLGAFDYVEKPLAPSQLAQIVKSHLRPSHTAAAGSSLA